MDLTRLFGKVTMWCIYGYVPRCQKASPENAIERAVNRVMSTSYLANESFLLVDYCLVLLSLSYTLTANATARPNLGCNVDERQRQEGYAAEKDISPSNPDFVNDELDDGNQDSCQATSDEVVLTNR